MAMPANRMLKYDVFIGTWNTTGRVLAVDGAPETTLSATDSYRWLPGRFFIVHEVDARFGTRAARSIEIMGYDNASRNYYARSFDDQGASESFELELSRRKWQITGESVRFTGQFDTQGDTLTGIWELKSKRSSWQPWIDLRLERAS
jgi:hypothetical protein